MFRCVLRLVTFVIALATAPIGAQAQQPLPPAAGAGPDLGPAEIQRLFDAYAVVQAQEMLKLTDAQYGQFVTRLKMLQEIRRRNLQARNQIIQDLRRMSNEPGTGADDNLLRDRLKALQEHEARSAADLRKAYDAIDQMLDVRQQARFRVFEEMLERRKIELLMRARQQNRPTAPRRN